MAKLAELGTIITGNTPKTVDAQNYATNDICFVKPSDIADGEVNRLSNTEFYISEYARSKARIIPPNSVLVTCIGIVGKIAINEVECAFNQQINAIVPETAKCIPEYIAFALQSKQMLMQDIANAAVVPILNKAQFSEICIQVPSLEEQQVIVEKMNKVSELITLRKEQLAKLDQFVKARFIELFGDPISNSMKLPTERMELRFNLKAGITTAADNIHDFEEGKFEVPCYGGNGIRGYVEEKSYSGNYPIIGRQGALCGNVQYATGEFHATEHAVLVSLLKDDNTVWVYHLLKLMDLFRFHTGAAQPGLAVKTLNSIDVIVADRELQNRFATFVEQTNKSKLTIQASLDKLEVMKKALMQEYFG